EVQSARAALLSFQSINEFDAADYDEAGRLNDEYAAIADSLGDDEMRLDAEFMSGMVRLIRDDDQAALTRLVEIAHEARVAGYESVGVTSFRVAATMAARIMDYDAAAAAIADGREYAAGA